MEESASKVVAHCSEWLIGGQLGAAGKHPLHSPRKAAQPRVWCLADVPCVLAPWPLPWVSPRVHGRKRDELDMMLQTLGINASNPVSTDLNQTATLHSALPGMLCTPCTLQPPLLPTPHRAPQHPTAGPRPAAYPGLLPPATAVSQVCVMTQDTARNFLAGSSTKSDQEKFQL